MQVIGWDDPLRTQGIMQCLYEVVYILLVDLHDASLETVVPGTSLDLLCSQLEAGAESVLHHTTRFLRTSDAHNQVRCLALGHDDQRTCLVSSPPSVLPVYVDEECCQLSQGHRLREELFVSLAAPDEGVSKMLEQRQAPLFHHADGLLNHGPLQGHAQRQTPLEKRQAFAGQGIVGGIEAVHPVPVVIARIRLDGRALVESEDSRQRHL